MTFADITMVPVANDRKADYLAFSRRMAEVYREHGATRVVDYWQVVDASGGSDFHADAATYEDGELRSLTEVAGVSETESIVVTVMEWPSKAARDRGVAAATADPRVLATVDEEPVFDGARVLGDTFEETMRLD